MRINISSRGIMHVPAHLKPVQLLRYPIDNYATFERWYMDSWLADDVRDRVYLPIQWTALYCNNGFGKNTAVIHRIQEYINALDKSKKYYTIVQYDDGILNDLSGLDILVVAMSGERIDYAIPLLCCPHNVKVDCERDIFCSFVGKMTHEVRRKILELRKRKKYHIVTDDLHMNEYCRILARSKFVLAPRGYGRTSFRIQEAVLQGAIPVYISDRHIIPYGQEPDYMLPLSPEQDIAGYLESLPEAMVKIMQENVLRAKPLFTYAGAKANILQFLK